MTIADKHREVVPSRRQCSLAFLRRCGRRPTSNSAACAQLLLAGPHQHVNAEALHRGVTPTDVGAPLATIYNTQNHFREARLLRDLNVAAPHGYFEIDTVDHHHFLLDDKQPVIHIPSSATCRKRVARSRPNHSYWPGHSDDEEGGPKAFPYHRMEERFGSREGLHLMSGMPAESTLRRPKPRSHARFLLKGAT
ncbi:transcriptional repressor [Mesorhizobium captivum]|uniref:transcriptional repressor n=1 Tax=Mesorhizobium captivum TaxID=3072319 RepID=UPI003D316913